MNLSQRMMLSVVAAVSITMVGVYVFTNRQQGIQSVSEDELVDDSLNSVEALKPVIVPDGWRVYASSDEWGNKHRIAFAYPSNWVLEEEYVTVFEGQSREYVRLERISLTGGGYKIGIHQKARGMGRPYDYEKTIGGFSARTWQSDFEEGYVFTLGIIDTEFIIGIVTPDKDTSLSDKFLSTIKFSE